MYLYFEIANKKKHLIDFHGTHGVRVYCTRLKYKEFFYCSIDAK